MTIEELADQDVVVLHLSGKIIGGTDAAEVNAEVHRLLEQGRRRFIIDLSQVEWMNSSGLGILINAHGVVQAAGGKVKVSGASEKIKQLLTITKLINRFALYPTVEEASAAF